MKISEAAQLIGHQGKFNFDDVYMKIEDKVMYNWNQGDSFKVCGVMRWEDKTVLVVATGQDWLDLYDIPLRKVKRILDFPKDMPNHKGNVRH